MTDTDIAEEFSAHIRATAIEAALKLSFSGGAEELINEARKIEAYLLGE